MDTKAKCENMRIGNHGQYWQWVVIQEYALRIDNYLIFTADGIHKRRLPSVIHRVDIGTVLQQVRDNVVVATVRCVMQCSHSLHNVNEKRMNGEHLAYLKRRRN